VGDVTTPGISTIRVRLNGKERDISPGLPISGLLAELELGEKLVVVERNGSILNRSGFAETILQPGDVLEIVHFVGGG
jgi:thiamine biosynthesis protein ThiS